MNVANVRRLRHLGTATVLFAAIVCLAIPAAAAPVPPAIALGATSDAAGTVTLANVACNTTSLCVALGENLAGNVWYVVAIHNGVPGAPQLIAGSTSMRDIVCSDADNCVAVGDHVVAIVDGVAGAAAGRGHHVGCRVPDGDPVLGGRRFHRAGHRRRRGHGDVDHDQVPEHERRLVRECGHMHGDRRSTRIGPAPCSTTTPSPT